MNDASAQIPRILHRVWLGPRPPDDTYLASWRTHCPGWEIKTWRDADLADVELPYVRQALAAGKWAFASDYLRLVALFREGGIYLDTESSSPTAPSASGTARSPWASRTTPTRRRRSSARVRGIRS